MKIIYFGFLSYSIFVGVVLAQVIDKQCFEDDPLVIGSTVSEKIVSNYDDLYNPNIMKPDMKLRKINICEDLETGKIKGISFTIRTIGSKLVISHQLGTLGSSENPSNRCTSFPIQDDD